MSKSCFNCVRLSNTIEEQKSKLQLLEARLKDLVRAYKVVCKEKENLLVNSAIPKNVDSQQEKRIAELEQNVVHLSGICGKLELERKQDKDMIKELEEKCEQLIKQGQLNDNLTLQQQCDVEVKPKKIEYKNKHCQTELETDRVAVPVADKQTQTDEMKGTNERFKSDTAVVTPLVRHISSSEETEYNDSDDQPPSPSLTSVTSEFVPTDIKQSNSELVPSSGVSLFYVNELARKEVELAEYRLRVREYECSFRELQWKYTNDKYKYQSRISELEQLNGNLLANNSKHSSSTLNSMSIAYIKNVLNKLLETKDKEQKQIMINALLTALNSIKTS